MRSLTALLWPCSCSPRRHTACAAAEASCCQPAGVLWMLSRWKSSPTRTSLRSVSRPITVSQPGIGQGTPSGSTRCAEGHPWCSYAGRGGNSTAQAFVFKSLDLLHWELSSNWDFLPKQHFMVFEKPEPVEKKS